jgi:hypothetical protein
MCKNIFLKSYIKIHYQKCKKNNKDNNKLIITENTKDNTTIVQYNKYPNHNHNYNHNYNSNNISNNNLKKNSTNNNLNNNLKKNSTNNNLNNNLYKNSNNNNSTNNSNNSKNNYLNNSTNNNSTNNNNNNNSKNNSNNIRTVDYYLKTEVINYTDNLLNYYFEEYNKIFYKYVEGKSIVIVGPAESIIGTNKGSIIDQFDLTIRLNKSLPLPSHLKDDIGTKCDIMYNSLNTSDFPGENNLNTKLYKKHGVKFVCSSYPFNNYIFHDDILNYVNKYRFDLPLKVMNDFKFKNFEKSLGTRPYTGTCAIMDILSYPIKYLYITGLDFYQTKYYSEYRKITKEKMKYNKNNVIHSSQPQMDYLKNISLFDNRIILDHFLDKLLYNDYYKTFKILNSFKKSNIFQFGDLYFKEYFEMKVSLCTFTKNNVNLNNDITKSYLIFTDNKFFMKKNNEYCIFITNNKNVLNDLNNNLTSKKFIGNFYFTGNKNNNHTIYITLQFLEMLKTSLKRIGIDNCNINLVIFISIILYLPEQHYFSLHEILNKWMLSYDEKKFVLFLSKKNIFHDFS